MLYLYAVGHEPQRDDESCGDVPHEWQRLIDCIEFPAFLGDAAMNVIADNRAFRNFFGRLFGNETEFCGQRFNMIRWQLLSPELRGTQLVDWEKAWAERSSVHLRYLLGRYPENEDLKKIEHEVKQDPDASAIFVRAAHVFRSRTEDVRLLNIPERGVTPVTMSILRPITSGSVWLGIISPPADLAQDVASA
jgi:hypothetical protein